MPHIPARLPHSTPTSTVPADAPPPAFRGSVVEVDVREDLRNGREPFSRIMAAVDALGSDELIHLRATFEPVPLFRVLGAKGFEHHSRAHAEDDWSIWFYRPEQAPDGPLDPGGAEQAGAEGSVVPAPGPASAVTAAPESRRQGEEIHLDVRGLEPPEPMVRTLAALETLPEGAVLVQHNVRVPQFLLPILAERGFVHEVDESAGDGVVVRIRRAG